MTEQKKEEAKEGATTSPKSTRRKARTDRLEIEALRAELDLPLEGSKRSDDSSDDGNS